MGILSEVLPPGASAGCGFKSIYIILCFNIFIKSFLNIFLFFLLRGVLMACFISLCMGFARFRPFLDANKIYSFFRPKMNKNIHFSAILKTPEKYQIKSVFYSDLFVYIIQIEG